MVASCSAFSALVRSSPADNQRRQPSVFELASVVTIAFDRVEPRGRVRRWAFWAGTLAALFLYERRVHESGRAVCLLGLKRRRVAAGAAALVALEVLAGGVSTAAAVGVVMATAAILVPLGVAGLRVLPARARLAGRTPRGRYRCPHRYLHSLASTKPGTGAELLRQVCAEADSKDRHLFLETGSGRLVSYYAGFGFEPCGNPVRFPNGELHLRMWRPPLADVERRARERVERRPVS